MRFPTTHWSVVLEAGRPDARASALSLLCAAYWPPVHAFIRHQVRDPEQAKDLTQAFFLDLLERRETLPQHLERARFRSFLLASVRHFLSNEWDRERARKRGGGVLPFSLDFEDGRLRNDPADNITPEKVFERQWAGMMVDEALRALRRECRVKGKAREFEALRECLTGDSLQSYQDIARGLEKTEGAVKVEVHRLRRRFRDLLRAEVAKTVADPAEVDDELRYLLSVLC